MSGVHWYNVAFLALFAAGSEAQSCTATDINRCADILAPYIAKGNIPSYSPDDLASFCGSLPAYYECVTEIKPYCPTGTMLTYQGAEDSSGYLCSTEGRRLALQFSPCFKTSDVQDGTDTCTFNGASFAELCVNTKYTINSCIPEAVDPYCGRGASNFAISYITLLLGPWYESFNCILLGTSTGTSTTNDTTTGTSTTNDTTTGTSTTNDNTNGTSTTPRDPGTSSGRRHDSGFCIHMLGIAIIAKIGLGIPWN